MNIIKNPRKYLINLLSLKDNYLIKEAIKDIGWKIIHKQSIASYLTNSNPMFNDNFN